MSRRVQVITSENYGRARQAATRAALAAPDVPSAARQVVAALDAMHERWTFVVDVPTLELAAGRHENVATASLRDLLKDISHELERRKEAKA